MQTAQAVHAGYSPALAELIEVGLVTEQASINGILHCIQKMSLSDGMAKRQAFGLNQSQRVVSNLQALRHIHKEQGSKKAIETVKSGLEVATSQEDPNYITAWMLGIA